MSDVTELPLTSLSKAIRLRQLSPVEVVESYLARIDEHDDQLGAFITVCRDEAIHAAHQAEKAIAAGNYLGPVHGIPLSLKDVFLTRGIRTTAGSQLLADWVPTQDADVVAGLKKAGAIILGKVHTTEFAMWATGGHALYRRPRNPWNVSHIPGGSSGGSAVAVAARFCPGSLGTDTGGSVRIPASFCGVVGLKPTHRMVSTRGVIPNSWSHDHVGILAKTVSDTALILAAMADVSPTDLSPTSNDAGHAASRAQIGDLSGIRVGVLRPMFRDVDPTVRAVTETAIADLAELGATAVDVELPLLDYFAPISFIIQLTEALAYHSKSLRKDITAYGEDVRKGLAMGQFVLGVQYVQALRAAKLLTDVTSRLLESVEVLACPTLAIAAPRVDEEYVSVDGTRRDINSVLGERTRVFNVTGHPAITLPCGFTDEGLPVGLQLAARHRGEKTLLAVAHTYERHAAWDMSPTRPNSRMAAE